MGEVSERQAVLRPFGWGRSAHSSGYRKDKVGSHGDDEIAMQLLWDPASRMAQMVMYTNVKEESTWDFLRKQARPLGKGGGQ